MEQPLSSLELKPRILYEVARAAWDGTLAERREDICRLVCEEFGDRVTRHRVANQIRVAMGLSPHEQDTVEGENDVDALMGLMDGPFIVNDPTACKQCPEAGTCCGPDCPLHALSKEPGGAISIDHSKCLGEGHCLSQCSFGGLTEKSQFVPLISMLRNQTAPVYASVAPAFTGQFGPDVTPGQLRSALLRLGFAEMVETALYADLITMKEAFEFDEHVREIGDFLITSCCCPVWIKLIEGRYPDLASHISPSVSPMIASGRVLKAIDPGKRIATFKTAEGPVELQYDFINVIPPMRAADVVRNSPLPWQEGNWAADGWIEVDKHTLRHKRFDNVFAVGDVAGVPKGKTAASVKWQVPVAVDHLVAQIEGRESQAHYGGYTSCPLITRLGQAMLIEFDYKDNLVPSFPGIIAPLEELWISWVMKTMALKPTYISMLHGRA